jgi:ankyrin repeat protein
LGLINLCADLVIIITALLEASTRCALPIMRLLKLDADGDVALTHHVRKKIPAYAVLSHTWEEEDMEVLFRDIVEGTGKRKPGYRKIQFCIDRVQQDNLQYFWVDSCCIDKSSSAELSESINSMYRWYRNATKCYVYLKDVSYDSASQADTTALPQWDLAFQRSRWFTRGWTLQELLAPAVVEFFSGDGKRLGDKSSLESRLHEITGIAVRALQGAPLSTFSPSERLSWAAQRETKMEEDKAYSLLGVFEIYMPLIYGEGEGNAFRRLNEEVAKAQEYHAEHTPRVAASFVSSVPPPKTVLEQQQLDAERSRRRYLVYESKASHVKGRHWKDIESEVNEWLNVTELDERFNVDQGFDKHLSSCLEGTCAWIFKKRRYLEWVSQDVTGSAAKFLWVCGSAGFGKSVLCAQVIQHIQATEACRVAYFFASSQWPAAGDLSYVVRSWTAQLARNNHDALELLSGFMDRSYTRRRATDSEVWTCFASLLQLKQHKTLFLDGLDEYPSTNDSRADFLARLKKVVAHTATRLLISSRDESDIKAELSPQINNLSGITLLREKITAEDVQEDIQLYSVAIVDKKLANKDESVRGMLANELAQRCEGMFLWIKMQQGQLHSFENARVLKRIVEDMPMGLHKTYQRTWETIQSQDTMARDRAKEILRWATFARRPMAIAEMSEALIISPYARDKCLNLDRLPDILDEEFIDTGIIGICSALVEARSEEEGSLPSKRTIHLVHPSVRDFLLFVFTNGSRYEDGRSSAGILAAEQSDAHDHLTRLCLTYLNYENIWHRSMTDGNSLGDQSFLEYAASYWHIHLSHVVVQDSPLSKLIDEFFNPTSENFVEWAKFYERSHETEDDSDEEDDDEGDDEEEKEDGGEEEEEKEDEEEDEGGEKEEEKEEEEKEEEEGEIGTPLYYATLLGLLPTVERILAHDRSMLDSVGGQYGTPLQAACFKGHHPSFKLLLDCGANPCVQGGEFGFALIAATASGDKQMLLTLIDCGADLKVTDPTGRTALSVAAENGHLELVRFLVDKALDVNTQDHEYYTPLHRAATNGHLEVVRLLLDRGAEVSAINDCRWTPLCSAVETGQVEVARQLLLRGADVNWLRDDYWTPLDMAIYHGNLDMIQMLLEHGAAIEVPEDEGFTSLHMAATRSIDMIRLMLDHGANTGIQTSEGEVVLHLSVGEGHIDMARLLLDSGADIQIPRNDGWTALHIAVENENVEMTKLLLDHGAHANAQREDGWTALHMAALAGNVSIVKLLLEHETDIQIRSKDVGWIALHAAAYSCSVTVCQLLVDRGADINASCDSGWTPLHIAAANGAIGTVRLLLDLKVDFATRNHDGFSPLALAVEDGHFEIAVLLLNRRADAKAQTSDGKGAVRIAADKGHTDLVRVLDRSVKKYNMDPV